jgi:hypothetical protein
MSLIGAAKITIRHFLNGTTVVAFVVLPMRRVRHLKLQNLPPTTRARPKQFLMFQQKSPVNNVHFVPVLLL